MKETSNYIKPEYVWINTDDPDLVPFRVKLPKKPREDVIAYHDLPKDEQFFRKEQYPQKLKAMENKVKRLKQTSKDKRFTVEDMWVYLENHKDEYADEIEWMRRQWYHRLYGYWFYNNGVATYINGWNWWFLNYWHLPHGGLPDYRARDRKWFLAVEYVTTTTKTFKSFDEQGNPIKNRHGYYDMVDLGRRLFLGTNHPKHRRSGETSKAACINTELATRTAFFEGGIQGLDKENGEAVFQKHVVAPFKALPWFFKPTFEGSTDPKEKLSFKPSAVRVGARGSVIDDTDGLSSGIDFAPTADRNFYDKRRLSFLHIDEAGKTINENVNERHRVIRLCLTQGSNIVGTMIVTTTVAEMLKRGGDAYYTMCEQSHWHERDENGSTISGLVNVFFPADECLEGFVDKFGNPMKEQARKYLQNKRDAMIKKGDLSGLAQEKRQHPLYFKECFTPSAEDVGFNVEILEKRSMQLRMKKETVRGNFVFQSDVFSRVEFVPCENGRWEVSLQLPPAQSNKRIKRDEYYYPAHANMFTASADPFRFGKTEGHTMSDGGGSVFMERDYQIDPDDKDVTEWQTGRFVCTYNNRPQELDEYCRDMLAMTVYYGAMMYPENNLPSIMEYFHRYNHHGYMKYGFDTKGQMRNKPGFHSGEESKQTLFNCLRDYIQIHGMREKHLDLLLECLKIRHIGEMTKYDLLTSCGGSLLGSKETAHIYRSVTKEEKAVATPLFRTYKY